MLTESNPKHNKVHIIGGNYYIDKRTVTKTERIIDVDSYNRSNIDSDKFITSFSYKLMRISKLRYLFNKIFSIFAV